MFEFQKKKFYLLYYLSKPSNIRYPEPDPAKNSKQITHTSCEAPLAFPNWSMLHFRRRYIKFAERRVQTLANVQLR